MCGNEGMGTIGREWLRGGNRVGAAAKENPAGKRGLCSLMCSCMGPGIQLYDLDAFFAIRLQERVVRIELCDQDVDVFDGADVKGL